MKKKKKNLANLTTEKKKHGMGRREGTQFRDSSHWQSYKKRKPTISKINTLYPLATFQEQMHSNDLKNYTRSFFFLSCFKDLRILYSLLSTRLGFNLQNWFLKPCTKRCFLFWKKKTTTHCTILQGRNLCVFFFSVFKPCWHVMTKMDV